MAGQLGPAAKYFFAKGLLAAGLSSALTALLAAAYATAGVLGWEPDLRPCRLRSVWGAIVIVGTILATTPDTASLFAQTANGILLPRGDFPVDRDEPPGSARRTHQRPDRQFSGTDSA